MTIAADNIVSVIALSKSNAAGISDIKDTETSLSIIHKRTWSPCVLAARVGLVQTVDHTGNYKDYSEKLCA